MDFSPRNPIVQLCIQGLDLERQGQPEEAAARFQRAWREASDDMERLIAAHHIARHQPAPADQLAWLDRALQLALRINDVTSASALPGLYARIGRCYEALQDPEAAAQSYARAQALAGTCADNGPFYHGTRADLQVGDLLVAGRQSQYDPAVTMRHVYFTASADGAGLAAALAQGDGRERVYQVEPTGVFAHDPNVTDQKFPGNPTRSYRAEAPLRIVGEVSDWRRQTPEEVQRWRERLARMGGEIIQ